MTEIHASGDLPQTGHSASTLLEPLVVMAITEFRDGSPT